MEFNAVLRVDQFPQTLGELALEELCQEIRNLARAVDTLGYLLTKTRIEALPSQMPPAQTEAQEVVAPLPPLPPPLPPEPPSPPPLSPEPVESVAIPLAAEKAAGDFTAWSPARLALMKKLDPQFAHEVVVKRLNALPGRTLTSKAMYQMRSRLKKEAEKLRPADPICEAKEEVAPTVPEPVAVADEPAPTPSPPAPPREVRVSDVVVPASDDPFDVKMFAAGKAKLGSQRAGLEPNEAFGPSSGISKGGGPDVQIIDANFADIRAWAAPRGCKYVGTNIGDVNRLRLKEGLPQVRLSTSARPVLL